jgi:DNA gyrase subunit A
MLVTDAGRLIRVPGDQVRITGRQVMGVMLFRLDAKEQVTAVFPVLEDVTEPAPGDGGEIATEHVPQSDADGAPEPDATPDDDRPESDE